MKQKMEEWVEGYGENKSSLVRIILSEGKLLL